MSGELLGLLIGFILTILIYSYAFGDNLLYRLGVHILVGVSAGYTAVVVTRQVILPVFDAPLSSETILWLLPIVVLALMFLLRRWVGNGALAFLIAVGAAIALVGAVQGTLIPQITAVVRDPIFPGQGLVVAGLTVCTLFTFQFTRRAKEGGEQWHQPRWQQTFTHIGRAVLMITLGTVFARTLSTSLVLLADQVSTLLTSVQEIADRFLQ